MSTVDRFLNSYIRQQKTLEFCCKMCWAALLAIGGWKTRIYVMPIRFGIGLAILGLLTSALWMLMRGKSRVQAAKEIESADPALDERLITVASNDHGGELIRQLHRELEKSLTGRPAALFVPWRRLILPAFTLISVLTLLAVIHFAQ